MKMIVTFLSILMLTGCATQKKPTIANRIFELFEETKKIIEDNQDRRVSSVRPKLPESYNVAVYFKDPDEKARSPQKWKWTQEDKDSVLASVKASKTKVGKVFELIDLGGEKATAKDLRKMAAQQGADGLLLIQGISEVESDPNGLALTYIAIVPTLFVEGNHVEGTFVSQAILWNVNEPFVHLGVQHEGDYSHNRPLIFRQIPRVIQKSKEESLAGLTKKLKTEFSQI